jgi:hypothetical protein
MQKKVAIVHKHTETLIHRVLHILEFLIAILTLIVLIAMLGLEVYRMFTQADYFETVDNYLHQVLTIVVGLEFVRMLVDLTPANTLEVLIVALSRHVILTHDDPLTIIVCVVSIAGLFATRRFLIPKAEMAVEMSEVVESETVEVDEILEVNDADEVVCIEEK